MRQHLTGAQRMFGVVVVAFALGACGDGEGTTSAPAVGPSGDAAGELEVVAEDIDFGDDAYAVAAGNIPVTYRNQGSIVHTLVIEDVDGFKLEVESKGDVDEGSIELEAGEYVLFCDVPGHRSAGMEATLQVE